MNTRTSRFALLFVYAIGSFQQLSSKALIWDLNGTVLRVRRSGYYWHLGPLSLAAHYITGGDMDRLKSLPFTVISQVTVPVPGFDTWQAKGSIPCLPDGRTMPDLMCAWQAGLITSGDCLKLSLKKARELWCAKSLFMNKREYTIVRRILRTIFSSRILSQQSQALPEAIALLRECSANGNHTHYVLSNWDAQSGAQLLMAQHMQPLWNVIPHTNVVMSGAVGMIKPHRNFFEYICARYNLSPADCVFIDDQIENIDAARACGMTAIHIKDLDYTAVRKELIACGVL